jgi:hypothetical protein
MNATALCFIPCSGSKNGKAKGMPERAWYEGLNLDLSSLQTGRDHMRDCISGSTLIPALDLYTGSFYSKLDKSILKQKISNGSLKILIVSAGYGVVDASEPILGYDATLAGKTAKMWKMTGLSDVIASIVLASDATNIFGFFSGNAGWSGGGSKYRYFFTEGIRKAIEGGLEPNFAGCFFRDEGLGQAEIPRALGYCFMKQYFKITTFFHFSSGSII